MTKLTPFALAAIALLGACSTTPQPTTPIATIVHPLRAGTGVVQAVMPTPMMLQRQRGFFRTATAPRDQDERRQDAVRRCPQP